MRYRISVFFTDQTSTTIECDDFITNDNGFSYAVKDGSRIAIFPHQNIRYVTIKKAEHSKSDKKKTVQNTQAFNTGCKYYCQDSTGERSCSCGMDMIFCGKNCAFATNVHGSTKAYEAPVYENHRAVRKRG